MQHLSDHQAKDFWGACSQNAGGKFLDQAFVTRDNPKL